MQSIAQGVAGKLRPGDIITLSGEVGSGKTAFARALIQSIASAPVDVTSPTFNLMQAYDVTLSGGVREMLWHLDLYRLKYPEEAAELGLRELWPHVTLIEWPDIIAKWLPQSRLDVSFDFGKDNDTRALHFYGDAEWEKRLRDVQ